MVSRFACTLTLSSEVPPRHHAGTVVSSQTLAPLCLVQYLESTETTLAVRHSSGTNNSTYLNTFNSQVLLFIFETSCTFKSKHFNSSAKSMSRVQSDQTFTRLIYYQVELVCCNTIKITGSASVATAEKRRSADTTTAVVSTIICLTNQITTKPESETTCWILITHQ